MKVLKLLILIGSLFYIQPAIASIGDGHTRLTLPMVENSDFFAGHSTTLPPVVHQDNNDSNFWFEEIEGDHTVYWQFNEVYDTVKESIANFATRLKSYVAEHGIGKLILDLRLQGQVYPWVALRQEG